MTEQLYISAHCSIAGNKVTKDGETLFENKGIAADAFLLSAYQHFDINYPRFYKMDNLCKLGWLAAEVLLADSFNKSLYPPEAIGLVMANRNSSLDTDIRYFETVKIIPSPALFVYTLPNIVLGEICIRNHFKGENDFFIFENFDTGFISNYVTQLFSTDAVQACICGWMEITAAGYDACLFLVEKTGKNDKQLFTKENIHHIYQITHG